MIDEQKGNYYVIADHLRTAIFALADGATIEPKGRGYIIRRLIKRSCLLAFFFNLSPNDLLLVSKKIIQVNSSYYQHLKEKEEKLLFTIEEEIVKIFQFIKEKEREIAKILLNLNNIVIPVQDVFFWYDTKGVPLELINLEIKRNGCTYNKEEFNKLLKEQKDKGKKDRSQKDIKAF